MSGGDYIIEFKPQGRYVKVTAVDPVSGIEAVVVGDAAQPAQTLQRVAIQKLEFLLSKLSP
jgi:hypothetical protein